MTTVIITRPKVSVVKTAQVYKQAGFEVFQAPCFDIVTNTTIQIQWLIATADTWIVLSVHALQHALKIAPELKPQSDTRVIAVGPAVEKAWGKLFDHAITSHPLMNSEGVIEMLKADKPNSVKILTTGEGRDLIKRHCMDECISYTQFNTYQRVPLAINHVGLSDLYQKSAHKSVLLTVTSSGILNQFMNQVPGVLHDKVLSSPIVVGAQRIAKLSKELGFVDIHLAESPSDEAMYQAVKNLSQ